MKRNKEANIEVIHRAFVGEIRESDDETGIIKHPISSLGIDSHGTIVWFSTVEWKGDTYKLSTRASRSVPILYEHGGGFFQADYDPLGINKALRTEGDGKSADTLLMATSQFDMKDGRAKERYRKHKEGFISGWSVGFKPKRELDKDEANEFLEAQGREERDIPVYLAPELWEYSSVVFPSNTDAYDNSARNALLSDIRASIVENKQEDIEQIKQRLTDLEALLVKSGDTPSLGKVIERFIRRLKY